MGTSAAHLAFRPILHPVLAWRAFGSLPLRALPRRIALRHTLTFAIIIGDFLPHVRPQSHLEHPRAPRARGRLGLTVMFFSRRRSRVRVTRKSKLEKRLGWIVLVLKGAFARLATPLRRTQGSLSARASLRSEYNERVHRVRGRRAVRRQAARVPQIRRGEDTRDGRQARGQHVPRARAPLRVRQGWSLRRGQEGARPRHPELVRAARCAGRRRRATSPRLGATGAQRTLKPCSPRFVGPSPPHKTAAASSSPDLTRPFRPALVPETGRARVLRRPRHLNHPQVAPGYLRLRGDHLHRRPRPGRGARARARQG